VPGEALREVDIAVGHHRFPAGAVLRTPALVLGIWYYRLRDLL
jgi:gamma-glutamylputrescine oxidase